MASLAAEHVLHFDLKCDNVLIDIFEAGRYSPSLNRRARARSGSGGLDVSASQLSKPHALPFSVCLADFGESMVGLKGSKVLRGTEVSQPYPHEHEWHH